MKPQGFFNLIKMGTRNLTMVISNTETKVAQYGQFDGYPSGVGLGLLNILSDTKTKLDLINNLKKCRFIEEDGRDKEFIDKYNNAAPKWSNEPDNRTIEQKQWWDTYCHINLAERVLLNISNSTEEEILLFDSSDFAKDGLFCEWAYVFNLDTNKLDVFRGFKKDNPVVNNFFGTEPNDMGYLPVQLVHSFDLSKLPSKEEFLSILEPQDEED